MSPDRKTFVYKNPVSSRAQKAFQGVERALRGWRTSSIESRTPSVQHNAEDLADQIDDGANLIVVGGDGQLRTAVEAAKLANLRNVVIVPVKGGNSCDGARTYQGKQNILRKDRLVNLLLHGEQVPVNTLDITVDGKPYGTAVNYAGVGLTAYSGEAVNGRLVRNARAKIPGSEHMNGLMRVLEGGVIGATVVRHLHEDIQYQRDGVDFASKELLYAAGSSLAGTFTLNGDALEQQAPQVVRYEIESEAFLRHLPGILYGLTTGTLASERMLKDTVVFSTDAVAVPLQIDGEHSYLEPGSTLSATVHQGSFQTMRPVA